MKSYVYKGKTVLLSEIIGTIVSNTKGNETHVRGQGGYVSTEVVNKQEFMVRTPTHDIPVQLSDVDIPLAPGQMVGLVYAEVASIKGSALVQVVNYSTRKEYIVKSAYFPIYASVFDGELSRLAVKKGAPALIVLVLVTRLSEWLWIPGIGVIGYGLYAAMKKPPGMISLAEHLRSQINYDNPLPVASAT